MSEESLEPLITQCPTCRTRFRVTDAQLNVAAGRVRCGACLSVFAGIEHLVLGAGPRLRPGESPNEALDALLDELRADTTVTKTKSDAAADGKPGSDAPFEAKGSDRPPAKPSGFDAQRRQPLSGDDTRDEVVDSGGVSTTVSAARADAEASRVTGGDDRGDGSAQADDEPRREARLRTPAATRETHPAANEPPPSVATTPAAASVALAIGPEDLMEPRRRKRRWWIPVATLVGVTLLAAQVLYLQFDAWSKNPDIRPVYEWLCPRLHCQLPVMRSLDDIRSKNLVVRDDPNAPGQLMVDALIVNQARFAQPFPVIELRFSSMDGRPLAALRFRPDEYLAGELKGATTFAPLTPVHIAFSIADPGADAVSYYIQFR